MPYNNSIQCPPSEDYDRRHSMIIELSSLECLLVSFDAIMDSLDSSTENLSKRVDKLYDLCDRNRSHISKNRSHVTQTFSPESVPNKSDKIDRKSSNSFLRTLRFKNASFAIGIRFITLQKLVYQTLGLIEEMRLRIGQ